MNKKNFYQVNSPNVVHETIDGETILLDLRTGMYYSMNESGSFFWDILTKTADLDESISKLADLYAVKPETISGSLRNFLNKLLEEDLLVQASSKDPDKNPGDASSLKEQPALKQSFEEPVLNKYEDMQHLLLLDPIHEVDNTGWPEPKEDA